MKLKQFDYDENTIFMADVVNAREADFLNFAVHVYIKGIDYDVTESIPHETLKDFEQWFVFKLEEELENLDEERADFIIDQDRDDKLNRGNQND